MQRYLPVMEAYRRNLQILYACGNRETDYTLGYDTLTFS